MTRSWAGINVMLKRRFGTVLCNDKVDSEDTPPVHKYCIS
jgi:hypothetical protein